MLREQVVESPIVGGQVERLPDGTQRGLRVLEAVASDDGPDGRLPADDAILHRLPQPRDAGSYMRQF